MRAFSIKQGHPVDAVITWVDGEDRAHKAKRLAHLNQAADPLHKNGINPHRWACGDELSFCLASIENNAPWIRQIFIVADAQTPDLAHLSVALRDKIKLVDHREIFAGYEHALPTFNSLSIETMLWRIEGLAEHFLYFNDDVFLTAPIKCSDVFEGGNPVLRGKWVDHSALGQRAGEHEDPAKFHDFMQANAATLMGFDKRHIFASAHVVFPMRRSVFARLFEQMQSAFTNNIAHKFRDLSQFQPQSLHNCAIIQAGEYALASQIDFLHLRTGVLDELSVPEVTQLLREATTPAIKFLCVNDLSQLEPAIPNVREWIEAAIMSDKKAA